MTSNIHVRDSVMTSLHVTRRTCTPGVNVFRGVGKVGRHFLMENNFLRLIDHLHSNALSTNTAKLNSTG